MPEIDTATEVFECTGPKWWDYDPVKKVWDWTRPPPVSQKSTSDEVRAAGRRQVTLCIQPLMRLTSHQPKKARKLLSEQQRLLKDFGCKLCSKVLSAPLSTPCGHTFCKARE